MTQESFQSKQHVKVAMGDGSRASDQPVGNNVTGEGSFPSLCFNLLIKLLWDGVSNVLTIVPGSQEAHSKSLCVIIEEKAW